MRMKGVKAFFAIAAAVSTVITASVPLNVFAFTDDNGNTYEWRVEEEGKSYWYENGVRQGTMEDANGVMGEDPDTHVATNRGREIYDRDSDGWYWLDSIYNGAKAVGKEVWMPYIYQEEDAWDGLRKKEVSLESDEGMDECVYEAMISKSGKWVRYDENGKMLKGWVTIEGKLADIYPDQAGNTYYYDNRTGLMAKGTVKLDGKNYKFDEKTGVLIGEVKEGKWLETKKFSYFEDDSLWHFDDYTYGEYSNLGWYDRWMSHHPDGSDWAWEKCEFDPVSRIKKTTYYSDVNVVGEMYEEKYDENFNMTEYKTLDADGNLKSNWYEYEYDKDGNWSKVVVHRTDGSSSIQEYKRNALGALTYYSYRDSANPARDFSYTNEYTYDKKGNKLYVSTKHKFDGDETAESTEEYIYDEAGRLTRVIINNYQYAGEFYTYDNEGRLLSVVSYYDKDEKSWEKLYEYTENGYVYTDINYNGSDTEKTVSEYDSNDNVIKTVYYTNGEKGITDTFEYTYFEW